MFKLNYKNKLSVKLKGLFSSSIPFEIRVSDSNWSPYFGKYENQKWGAYDSESCWCLSSVNSFEDQMEWLWKNNKFSQEAKDFFTNNGYIDSDGDFSLSERFHEILDGNFLNGGTPEEAWQSFASNGMIPRSMLTYSVEQANKWVNPSQFAQDYFNPLAVTQQMKDLGNKFRNYITIQFQTIGTPWTTPTPAVLRKALQQAPINIGISCPIVNVYNWNNTFVQYDGGRTPQHEVELYALDSNNAYQIFDQYLPNLKTLSSDYYIILCHQGIVNAVASALVVVSPDPTLPNQATFWAKFWANVLAWYNKKPQPYPEVPIGGK